MDLATGNLTWGGIFNISDGIRLIGDESSSLSISGDYVYVTMVQSVGGMNITSKNFFHVIHEWHPGYEGGNYPNSFALFNDPEIPVYSSEGPGGHTAPSWAPAVISNGMILWISDGSGVAAVMP